MNTHLSYALLALAAAAQAALPTSGLPSGDYPIAAHLSAETLNATKLGQALNLASSSEPENAETLRKVKERLGLDLNKDLRDLTFQGTMKDGESNWSGILRGRFDKAKIESFAASRQIPSKTVSGLKAWEGDRLLKALTDDTEPDNSKDEGEFYVVILDGSTLLLADEPMLAPAVAAAKSNLPWKHAGLAEAVASASNAWLVVAADVEAIEKLNASGAPDSQPTGAKTGNLALGENAADIQVRINADFVGEKKAKEALAQLQGFLGLAQLGLVPSDEDTPEDARNKRDLQLLVQGLKVTGSGTKVAVSLDYPVNKAVETLLKTIAEGKAQAAGAAAPKGK